MGGRNGTGGQGIGDGKVFIDQIPVLCSCARRVRTAGRVACACVQSRNVMRARRVIPSSVRSPSAEPAACRAQWLLPHLLQRSLLPAAVLNVLFACPGGAVRV